MRGGETAAEASARYPGPIPAPGRSVLRAPPADRRGKPGADRGYRDDDAEIRRADLSGNEEEHKRKPGHHGSSEQGLPLRRLQAVSGTTTELSAMSIRLPNLHRPQPDVLRSHSSLYLLNMCSTQKPRRRIRAARTVSPTGTGNGLLACPRSAYTSSSAAARACVGLRIFTLTTFNPWDYQRVESASRTHEVVTYAREAPPATMSEAARHASVRRGASSARSP